MSALELKIRALRILKISKGSQCAEPPAGDAEAECLASNLNVACFLQPIICLKLKHEAFDALYHLHNP